MSVAMPVPSKITINGTSMSVTNRTLRVQYGEGYEQSAKDGLNSKIEEWDIVWAPLTLSEMQTVETALDAVGGWDILTWTPCFDTVEKGFNVVQGKYSRSVVGRKFKISCKLRQTYNPIGVVVTPTVYDTPTYGSGLEIPLYGTALERPLYS